VCCAWHASRSTRPSPWVDFSRSDGRNTSRAVDRSYSEPPPPQCGKSSCWREVGDSDPPKSTLCRSTNAPIGCSFARAPALNKPLIVGETGIKATNDATRTTRAPCCAHETATLAQSIQLLLFGEAGERLLHTVGRVVNVARQPGADPALPHRFNFRLHHGRGAESECIELCRPTPRGNATRRGGQLSASGGLGSWDG